MTTRSTRLEIKCCDHGSTLWKGHVICCACNQFYQTSDEHAARYAPLQCACGVRLMPDRTDKTKEFSARAICPRCYTGLCLSASGIARQADPGLS